MLISINFTPKTQPQLPTILVHYVFQVLEKNPHGSPPRASASLSSGFQMDTLPPAHLRCEKRQPWKDGGKMIWDWQDVGVEPKMVGEIPPKSSLKK